MEQKQIEVVGKVFVVVGGMRRCLICEGLFTPKQAADHSAIPCYLCIEQRGEVLPELLKN